MLEDTNSISSAIKADISEKDTWEVMANVVFLGSDGAFVNKELKNSLIKVFRDEMPSFVWFFSDRLELALKDALPEWMNPIATSKSSKKSQKLKELYDFN